LASQRDPFFGLQRRHFGAIMADPPWNFRSYTALQTQNPGSRRDVDRHYETMTWKEIAAMPVGQLAARHCHLFLWATGPCLQQAFMVMDAWGFKYSAMAFVWVKLKRSHNPFQLRVLPSSEMDLHVGLGLTTRHNAEFCLLGRSAASRRNAKDVREVIMAPVRQHSRKPDEAFARVQRYCDGPYLDLFSREDRPGWTSWGLEANKFAEAAE